MTTVAASRDYHQRMSLAAINLLIWKMKQNAGMKIRKYFQKVIKLSLGVVLVMSLEVEIFIYFFASKGMQFISIYSDLEILVYFK